MESLGESEDGWCYKIEINGREVTEDLDLPPESHLDPVETLVLFHIARLTHESAEIAARLLQENSADYHLCAARA